MAINNDENSTKNTFLRTVIDEGNANFKFLKVYSIDEDGTVDFNNNINYDGTTYVPLGTVTEYIEVGPKGPMGSAGAPGATGATGPSGQSVAVEDEGSVLTTAAVKLNFVGTGVTVTEPSTDNMLITIGGGGKRSIDSSMGSTQFPYVETSSGTYRVARRVVFHGSTIMGSPTNACSVVFNDSGVTGQVRIYDLTNGLVIAESAVFSNTVSQILDFGTISNVSTGSAVWEFQLKRISGGGSNKTHICSVQILF